MGGEVDNKANTAPVVVEVKVGAELGNYARTKSNACSNIRGKMLTDC